MRYLFALPLILCTAAIAEDEYIIDHQCVDDGIVFFVGMRKPGVLKFKIPHDLCGKSI